MSYFKAKMHQIRFRLGLRPRPRWGSLQRSPRPPSCIKGALLLRGREGRGEEGEERGGEEEGKGEGEKKGRGREEVAQGPAHARAGSVCNSLFHNTTLISLACILNLSTQNLEFIACQYL